MDVSIIIVNYNSFEYTLSCLASIHEHSSLFSFEIILIDNASTYFPEEIIRSKFKNAKIIINAHNTGFSKAVNQGIQKSMGDYILLMNNDTVLFENSINICLRFLKSNPQYGFLSPQVTFPDGLIQPVANSFPSIKNELIELFRLTKFFPANYLSGTFQGRFFDHLHSREVDWVWGTFMMFPGKILETFKNKKLPDDFFLYYEDVQWCYMAKKKGFKTYYLAETTVIHHQSKSLGKDSNKKNIFILKNEEDFLKAAKGKLYTFIYLFIKGLTLISQKQKHLRDLGFIYLKKTFNHNAG